jgi:hypothetical protein
MDHYYYLLKVLKNVLYNAQNDQQTAPMALEHPKTPSWAFSAPRLAKKRRSWASWKSPLQACCLCIYKLHPCTFKLAHTPFKA